jgi:Tol biopolymer transport system component
VPLALAAMAAAATVAIAAGSPNTRRVDLSAHGAQSLGGASGARTGEALSGNGRIVAFQSTATNLVADDTNRVSDIFVRALGNRTTRRVSVSDAGHQANGASTQPSLSQDGRFVAFASLATNLVAGGASHNQQIYIRDLKSRTTRLVSVSSSGKAGNGASASPSISADGRFVAFASQATNLVRGGSRGQQVFVHDLKTGDTKLVSASSAGHQANGDSFNPSIAADGRYVAFASTANNLSAHPSPYENVFVRDLKAGTTTIASVTASGHQSNGNSNQPSISADGRFVAFASSASNLVKGDSNHVFDVFERDLLAKTTRRVSVSSSGRQANNQSFLVDPAITATGRFVTFTSKATNLIAGGSGGEQVFVRDVGARRTTLVSRGPTGQQGNNRSFDSSISADGAVVAFDSLATNLVTGDTNGLQDVFVRGPLR